MEKDFPIQEKEKIIRQSKAYKKVYEKVVDHTHSKWIFPDGSRWYCGITNNPERRKKEHKRKYKDMMFFKCFYAYSPKIAHQIEKDLSKKFRNYPHWGNVTESSHYVYIFKAFPTIIDKL